MRSKSYAVQSKTWMWNIREWLFLPAFWLWEKNSAGKIDVFTAYVCAAQRGRDAFGTATRISASLSRRLSAFFGSTPDQAPKAAKYAVLTPGHAGFPNRVKRSEGSDSALPPCTFRKYCAQSEKTATSPSCKQIMQPSGAATPRNSDAHKRIAVPKAFCVLWEHPPTKPQKRQNLPF